MSILVRAHRDHASLRFRSIHLVGQNQQTRYKIFASMPRSIPLHSAYATRRSRAQNCDDAHMLY